MKIEMHLESEGFRYSVELSCNKDMSMKQLTNIATKSLEDLVDGSNSLKKAMNLP